MVGTGSDDPRALAADSGDRVLPAGTAAASVVGAALCRAGLDDDGGVISFVVLDADAALAGWLGLAPGSLVGASSAALVRALPEPGSWPAVWLGAIAATAAGGRAVAFEQRGAAPGEVLTGLAYAVGGSHYVVALARGATGAAPTADAPGSAEESRRERELTIEVLRALSGPDDERAIVREVATLLHRYSGCDAVGIRLRSGGDFPYSEARGFSPEFVALEGSLCARGPYGELVGDASGRQLLECYCGAVLSGRLDRRWPGTTEFGSYWTNDSDALPSLQAPGAVRGHCVRAGYRSLALIPLRSEGEALGLIQLNARRAGAFTAESILLYESLAASIAAALASRRAYQDLQRSQQIFAGLVRASTDGIAMADERGTTVVWNEAQARMTGVSAAEALGRPAWDLLRSIVPHERQSTEMIEELRAISRRYQNDTDLPQPWASVSEREVRRPDGTRIWLQSTLFPLVGNGTGRSIGTICRDVTEQRRVQEALRRSEQRYRFLANNARDVIWTMDPDGRFTYVSPSVLELRGYTVEEAMEQSVYEAFTPESADTILSLLHVSEELGANVPAQRELEQPRKDGSTVWTEASLAVVRDADGRPVGLMGASRDISERRRAEQALREYERAVEETGDLVAVIDSAYRYVLANAAYCAIVGRPREDVIGHTVLEVLGDHLFHARVEASLNRAFAGEVVERTTQRLHPVTGATRHFHGYYYPIQAGGRPVERVVVVLRDVTARVEQQRESDCVTELLRLLGQTNTIRELMQEVTALLQSFSGCEAVGVRLKDGDDYPYFETRGFPPEFVEAERFLCERGPDGAIRRDSGDNPVLECMCGNVLRGRFDPEKSFFTQSGSFWSNSTTRLLATTTEADRQARTRNRCNGEGYESVALIPMRTETETFGLLQLNDRRPGRFTRSSIALYERLAGNLAASLGRRQALTALRESERQLRSVWDGSPIGLERYDREGHLLDANQASLNLFGVADVATLRVCRLFDLRNLPPEMRETLRTGEAVRYQLTYSFDMVRELAIYPTARTGSIDVDVLIAPLVGAGGQVDGYLVHVQDVTEQKRAERLVRESEERLSTYVASAPLGLFVMDGDGHFLDANATGCRMFGYDAEGLADARVAEVTAPDHLAIVRALMVRLRETGRTEGEVLFRRRDGATFWGAASAVRLGPDRFLAFVSDVTERKHAEQVLRESERKYRIVADNTYDWEFWTDARGAYVYSSPSCLRVTGYPPEAFERDAGLFVSLVHPDDRSRFLVHRASELATGLTATLQLRIHHRNGSERWIEHVCRDVYDDDGHYLGRRGSNRDVTDHKRLEAQLLQAQKMESVGRLAGGVAHDFNNLLTAITGYGEMAWGALEANPEARQDLEEVLRSAERASSLTRQLLAFSRKQVLEMRTVNLNDVVRNLGKLLGRLIGEQIELRLDLDHGLSRIYADPVQVEQVLVNLSVNARDAMPAGGRLTIATANAAWPISGAAAEGVPDSGSVCLLVSDTGEGMTDEVKAHIFEPFFTTKEAGKGTGLGLATVYGIVKQHGGEITVDSSVGNGTCIGVYLPALPAAPEGGSQKESSISVPGGGETVLLAEDEKVVRAIARRALDRLGYRVLEAGNGEEAMRLVETGGVVPDLLITDLVMPHMGGLELARQLRALLPNLRVLYTSGYTEAAAELVEATRSGGHYLPKPFTARGLALAVREVLDRRE